MWSLASGQHCSISPLPPAPSACALPHTVSRVPLTPRFSPWHQRGVSCPESSSRNVLGCVMGCLSPTALPTPGSFQLLILPSHLYPCLALGTGPRNPSGTSQPKGIPEAHTPAHRQYSRAAVVSQACQNPQQLRSFPCSHQRTLWFPAPAAGS